ncbi:hypothetical protein AB0H15_39405 [Streptomyces milbemycinicus]
MDARPGRAGCGRHLDSVPLVRGELDRVLAAYDPSTLAGVSCIARGSDSLFADAVLAVGGRLGRGGSVAGLPGGDGEADVVYEARAAGLPVDVVWPDGASRQA